jgi:hypothetical protein
MNFPLLQGMLTNEAQRHGGEKAKFGWFVRAIVALAHRLGESMGGAVTAGVVALVCPQFFLPSPLPPPGIPGEGVAASPFGKVFQLICSRHLSRSQWTAGALLQKS